MVHADSHGCLVLLTYINKRYQLCLNLLQLCLILLIGILQMLKGAAWVYVIARIDTHLLTVLCSNVGCMGGKVDIGHQGLRIAVRLQAGRYILHILSLASSLRGKPHQLTTSIDDALGLCHTAFRIVGIDSSHRLNPDGIITTDSNLAYATDTTNSSYTHI